MQNEVERLDREWQLERERLMVTGRYGSRHVPSEGGSIVAAVVVGGFGLFWTVMASSMGAPGFFPLFGIVFIILGVGASISSFMKAGEYAQAHRKYQQRREKLLARHSQHEQR